MHASMDSSARGVILNHLKNNGIFNRKDIIKLQGIRDTCCAI